MLGHDGPPQNSWLENLVSGERLTLCPLQTVLRWQDKHPHEARELEQMLREYTRYERGTLLVSGGSSDQPARYLEYMEKIESLRALSESRYFQIVKEQQEEENRNRGAQPNG